MKKLFSFVVFLFLFALLQTLPSYGQSQESKELTEARNSYNAELQKAIKPVNDRYIPKLEELKKQLIFNGDIKGAVAVEDVITRISSGQSLQQQGDKDPQELKEIKKHYMVEFKTATKPVRSLYLAKLEVLKQQLALSGALKAALAVEEEMEKIKAEQILPQDSTPTTMTKTKRWNVTEGPYGEWKGTWIIDPNHPDFNIVLKSQYGTIRSSGRYTKNGDSVSIERTGSSDGNDCNYTGNISGKKVSGTYFCKNGGPFQWNATISD